MPRKKQEAAAPAELTGFEREFFRKFTCVKASLRGLQLLVDGEPTQGLTAATRKRLQPEIDAINTAFTALNTVVPAKRKPKREEVTADLSQKLDDLLESL